MAVLQEITDRAGKSRWRLSDPVRWMLKGAGVMLAVVLFATLCVGGWILYVRSLHGQMAYEYIQQVIAQQQAQQKPPVTK